MAYQIRNAQENDWKVIQSLYAGARQFMALHGNPDQWGNQYPPEVMLLQDIAHEKLYLIYDEYGTHGVFYFAIEEDPTYDSIYEGDWHRNATYGVIHRIAGDGSGGVLRAAVEYASGQISYLRIDTHEDNYVMQRALEKQGFVRCGIVRLEDGTLRIAYDKMA